MPKQFPALLLSLCLACTAFAADTASPSDLNAAGVQYYAAREWDDAIESFSAALDLSPENQTVARNLCNAYQAKAAELANGGDNASFGAAADLLDAAILADPSNPSPLVQLGSYFIRLDMVRDAVNRLEEAIQLDPQNLDAHDLLGDAYYKDNDLPAALAQWELVYEYQPGRRGLTAKLDKAYGEETVEGRFNSTSSRHFQISFAPRTNRVALGLMLRHAERAYRDIGRRFGGVYPPTPIQIIVYTAEDFRRATGLGEHVAAVYDGKIRVPLSDKAGRAIPPEELQRRLFHEYTHVVVRHLTEDKVPWWFNEGLAETFSNDLSQNDQIILQNALADGQLIPFAEIEGTQLAQLDLAQLRLAYTQSHAAVQYLWRTYGQRSLVRMMNELAMGIPPEQALRIGYRKNYPQLETDVANSIGGQGYR